MKYSTRPKNTRDRSSQVKRSPHINFQKHYSLHQDRNTYSPSGKLNQSSFYLCSPQRTTTGQPVTVIAKIQQPLGPPSASAQETSYIIVDDQQSGTSRQMIFNPPSVAPSQQEESQHNTSGLSSLFAAIPSVLQYQQINTPQPFSPSQPQQAPSPVPSSTYHEQSRPPSHSKM